MKEKHLQEKHLLFLSDEEERDEALRGHSRLQEARDKYLQYQEKLRPVVEKALTYLFGQKGAWEFDAEGKGVQFLFYPYGPDGVEDRFDPLIDALAEWTAEQEVHVRISETETVRVIFQSSHEDSTYPPSVTVKFRHAVAASEFLFEVPGAREALRQAVQRELDDKEEEMKRLRDSAKRYVDWMKRLE